jgi:UDP-glucose 4-epimerase
MNIFLSGGTGFIGSYIAMELVKNGHCVTILARDKNKIPALEKLNGIELVQGNLSDSDIIEKNLKGKDAVILTALNYTKQTASEVLLEDTLPNIKISDLAVKADVKHFIYTSSTAVNDNVYMIEENKIMGLIKCVDKTTKQHPTTYYGATKAATENYLLAQSYQSSMHVNIIRPGYTFGNPVIEGTPTQSDTRFRDIVRCAMNNKPIYVIKKDGTQFIWAGDLATLYINILHCDVNRKTYFGLSEKFYTWETIAVETVIRCNSNSEIVVEDRGWSDDGTVFDVSDIKKDFNLRFDAWEKILEHIDYYIDLEKSALK